MAGLLVLILCVSIGAKTWAGSTSTPVEQVGWSAPSAKTLKRISSIASDQHEPSYFQNLSCNLISYRTPSSSTMQNGCFTETAYGLFDSDTDTVIFNGTDEGVPLLPNATRQILLPWPKSSELVVLDVQSTGGDYISLYRNFSANTADTRNLLGQITSKQLTASSDIGLRDRAGQRLLLNARTIAFSDNGSWLVAETLTGSFVRINLSSLEATPFAPAFGSTGSPALLMSQVAVSNSGRFIAINNETAKTLQVYDLEGCTTNRCPSYDYRDFINGQISGLQAVQHLRFINESLLSFETRTINADSGGVYELAPTDSISSLTGYLGLGDSFTSGEGAFDYTAGTDSENNRCHLSALSYPKLLSKDIFGAMGGHSVACSGAVIKDVGSTASNYRGQVRDIADYSTLSNSESSLLSSVYVNYLPGYIAQQHFVERYQPKVITVSVGGNDIGFGDILERCVTPHFSRHTSDQICYNTYEDRLEEQRLIDRTVPRWTALYKQLVATAPSTRLYVIGYPSIAADNGNCSLNTWLSKSELEFSEEIIAYLNKSIAQAAKNAGAQYVDISQALYGHRLCEARGYAVAVNGLTAGRDAGFFGIKVLGSESYHPNALGHNLIEQMILQKTHNFTANPPGGPTSISKLLDAPKSGRAVYNKVPQTIAPRIAKKGGTVHIAVDGRAAGLRPKHTYTAKLGGANGTTLTNASSDDQGNINTDVSIPGDATTGGQTIDIIGDNQNGEITVVSQPIFIPIGENDADGDSLRDDADSCPTTPNSGTDTDQDGIDDACDSIIGASLPDESSGAGANGNGNGDQATSTAAASDISAEPLSTSTISALGYTRRSSQPKVSVASVQISPKSHQGTPGEVLGAHAKVRPKTAVEPSIGRYPMEANQFKYRWLLSTFLFLWVLVLLIMWLWSWRRRSKHVYYHPLYNTS